jgi:ubiquitin-conjugating enzyme E2 variant
MIRSALGILGSVLLADFLSGLAHWIEDSYFSPDTQLIGPTIRKNILHHGQPQAFVRNPWAVTIRSSLFWAVSTGVVLYPFGILGPVWVGALGITVFANQIQKWAHMNGATVPRAIRWLQASRLLQTPAHHNRHHGGRLDTHYCVVTNALNPVLDAIGFWRALETVIRRVSGCERRPEMSYDAV